MRNVGIFLSANNTKPNGVVFAGITKWVEKQKVVKPAELLDEISLCGNRGVNTAIA
jgi:hypothetical protein